MYVAVVRKCPGVLKLNKTDLTWSQIILIYINCLTNPENGWVMVKAAKQSLIPMYSKGVVSGARECTGGCEDFRLNSREYFECVARTYALYYPVGTCKMGLKNDPEAVVDQELRVYCVKGLRVVNSSITPTITNSPVIMITVMGRDLIKKYWP